MEKRNYIPDTLIASDIDTYLETHQKKSLLRFITCGSVDDGKSTLIGRLLYDSKMIFDDQLSQLINDSKKFGTQDQKLEFALLVDGLSAEQEQGITIDVAYRFFTTEKRKFIVADTPGHKQYTRNMVTAASNADLAVILIDARKGVLTQTKRHTYLCSLLGIKKIILAVNKIDLINYDKKSFTKIVNEYKSFANSIGLSEITSIPISALLGDNITKLSNNIAWYSGDTLIEYLEKIDTILTKDQAQDFRMPVQWVNRPNLDFRGFSGKIISGNIKPGDEINILPSNIKSKVIRIVTYDGDLEVALAGQSVTIVLDDNVDCSRGQIITSVNSMLEVAGQFEMTIIWFDEKPLMVGREYNLKTATRTVSATIGKPKYKINVDTMDKFATRTLELNDIGVANVTTNIPIPFTNFKDNYNLGGVIFIDKLTNATVGAGLINFSLRRAQNLQWQETNIKPLDKALLKNQKPIVIWMTGLSGAGKSSIANVLEKKLFKMNHHTFILDGDNLRHGLNKDLGYTDSDRIENIRRASNVAKLMLDSGLIVITAFISPFRSERKMARDMMNPYKFYEVFVDAPLSAVEKRDVKGLYAKVRSGQLKNFTGIDSPYEVPNKPDIHINTENKTIDQAAEHILNKIINDIKIN